MFNLWVIKNRGCLNYMKFISFASLRQFSKRALPIAVAPLKNQDDELSSLQSVVSNKQERKQLETSHADEKPIIFVRSKQQMLDLSRITTQVMEKSVANVYAQDLLRLMQLYKDTNSKSFNFHNDGYKKYPETTVLESSEVVPLKLVNAVEPRELEWQEQVIDLVKLPRYYMKLAKVRLTGLVVLTALGGYMMAPAPFCIDTLLFTCVGTFFTSASANCINQLFEVPFDSQMRRTKNRVLVRGLLTPLHVLSFATVCGASGLTILTFGANGLTAALGGLTLALYTLAYTPMKRMSILNTWVGSVVGAIPPVMGWAACTGQIGSGGLLLGAILFAWQFPHFNSLSWNLRADYARAGYRMMSVVSPDLCRRTTLRYSVALLALCSAAPLCDLTTWTFAVDSLPVNLYFIYLSWKFHENADTPSARKLFRASLIYLPIIMALLGISKKPQEKNDNGVISVVEN
uniref:Protoheme IX farnesyltransferase, mitochondrial n=1 Tax=Strigamia maritima TaxID=126957 RepID=T1IXM4_STRMM